MLRKVVLRLLPFRHLFHTKCVAYLNNLVEIKCPMCRSDVNDREAVERQKYKKYSNQDRERIVACANREEDWVLFATTLGIKYKTAFHWVRSGRDVMLKKGGIKPEGLKHLLRTK
nr:unnamed protein product [Callosobruchus analis]